MRNQLIILISLLIAACGPKYIHKPNGVPIISCANLDNRKSALSISVTAECLNRNMPLLQEIYVYELKSNDGFEQSFKLPICISPEGAATVQTEATAPNSQLEKFVRSYVEVMEFPRSNGTSCFTAPFAFRLPEKEV